MRLYHFGCGMNRIFGSLTVFHAHNYADNYSPEVLKLQFSGPSVIAYVQNIVMPTLQQMYPDAIPRNSVVTNLSELRANGRQALVHTGRFNACDCWLSSNL